MTLSNLSAVAAGSYIIDIIHNLLLKYFLRKENSFSLSSLILKEKYGHLYNYYIEYLLNEGIIILKKNYLKGSNARVYALNAEIISGEIIRFNNCDKILLKKNKAKHFGYEIDNNNIIDKDIKFRMIQDLYSVEIQLDKAIFYLGTLKDKNDTYHRSKYSAESIAQKDIFYHFDKYGRMHTNFTILKSFIRKNCLLIDGEEICEVDIRNSHPFFLSILIKTSDTNWVNKEEFDVFFNLSTSGNYYQYLMDKLNLDSKDEAKEITYRVLFGQNRKNSKCDLQFSKLFPTIHFFIKLYKKEFSDYRILAHHLQRAESNVIYNRVIRRVLDLNPSIKIITIHDSLIIQKKWESVVSRILDEELSLVKSDGIQAIG